MSPRFSQLVLLLCLAACTSSKPPASAVANGDAPVPTAPLITQPVTDKADITYMARYMLPGRMQSASAIYGGLSGAASSNPGGTQAAGVAAAGTMGESPASRSGVATAAYAGAALSALSGFAAARGPAEVVGRYYLPEVWQGSHLGDLNNAREAIRIEMRRRINHFTQEAGRTVACFSQCDGYFPTFQLTKSPSHSPWRFYDPESLYLTVLIYKPKNQLARTNAVLDRILGYSNAWEGALFIALSDQPPTGDSKSIDGEMVPDFPDRSAFSHPVERRLLRALTTGPEVAIGSQGWHQFAWNSRVFTLGSPPDVEHLILAEISPQTDYP